MFKNNLPYIIFVLGFLFILYTELNKPQPVDWTETYSCNDKIPFGTYAFFELYKDQINNDSLIILSENFADVLITDSVHISDDNDLIFNLIFINKGTPKTKIPQPDNFYFGDVDELLKLVNSGTTVFIASENISEELLDSLSIEQKHRPYIFFEKDSLNIAYGFEDEEREFLIHQKFFKSFFDSLDQEIRVIASCNDKTVFIEKVYGEGRFFLHSMPVLLSNYFILKKSDIDGQDNYKIAEKIIGYLPDQKSYWDEFFKYREEDIAAFQSPLRYILSRRSLTWAVYTTLSAFLLLILFKSKRLQQAIPVVEPEKNLDADFAKTIGMLYFNERNNIDLAMKKIKYWKEKLRTRFNVSTSELDERFISTLALKTSIDVEEIRALLALINRIQDKKTLSDEQLIRFNSKLEKFYVKTEK